MNTKEALIAARKLVEREEDWANYMSAGPKQYCTLFAIEAAVGRSNFDPSGPECKAFCEASGVTFGAIGTWNDVPTRTHAEILTAFDKAIAAA